MNDNSFIIINGEIKQYVGNHKEKILSIPDGIRSIGCRAFEYCWNLEEVIFPDSLLSVGDYAFLKCSGIKSVVLPKNLRIIGNSAFSECKSLEDIEIPESVEEIGKNAFHGTVWLKKIKEVYKEKEITLINHCLMKYKGSEKRVIVPDGVLFIAHRAFKDCDEMTEIVLPGSVKKICGGRDREGAFAECKALSKVSSEIEHADIEAGAFFKTPFLDQTEQDFIMSGTLLIACNVKDHVVIPEKTTCICSVIFQKDVFVNSIHISKNVKYIAKDAFAGAVFKEITVDPENRWFSVSDGVLYDDKNQIVITHECCHERIRIKDGTKEILPEAFMGDSVLEYVELPDSLKKIGRGAFSYCDKLTDIKMPSAMDSIDERAFNGCSSLESIEIPDGVELLDEHTFSGCSNLKKIRIPHSVTRIGENAFEDCNKIEELLATGVMHINTCIFYESKYSEPLIFPIVMPHLVEFPSATKVFNLCRALGYLQYKEYYHDEESIGKHQKYCSSQIKSILPKIISDDNVRALQTYLSFRKVTAKSFEDNMLNPALENGAKECTAFLLAWKKDNLRTPKQKKELSLESLEDPSTITEKQKMKIWQYEKSEDGIRICGYRGDEKDLVIPDSIAGVPVTKIEENAFCWKTKGYTKKKNDRDVYYRRQLQSVVIPETVKEIGRNAFWECGSLEKVVIKGSVEEIKEYTFLRCNNLKSVTLPESLQKIGDSAFSGCESIEEIRIPRGVSVIGSGAFSGCEKLKDVEMPAGLERIEDFAFSNCKELSTITFPNSLNTIGEDTFSGCCNLGRVIFPANLKNIGKHAFARCKNLITENLAVEEIGEGAFSGCSSMQDENGFYISNGILFNYYGREHKLIIPNGVIKIASFALSGNEELHEVIIADTCEEIHEGVFWGCNNLNSVYIPGSVSYIEHEQFSDYKKVTIKTEPGTYAEEYAKYYGMQVSTN